MSELQSISNLFHIFIFKLVYLLCEYLAECFSHSPLVFGVVRLNLWRYEHWAASLSIMGANSLLPAGRRGHTSGGTVLLANSVLHRSSSIMVPGLPALPPPVASGGAPLITEGTQLTPLTSREQRSPSYLQ